MLKNEQRWVLVGGKNLYVLTATSDMWPEEFDFVQRASLEDNQKVSLYVGTEDVTYRFLFKGPKKYVNEIYDKYDQQLRRGRSPENINVTYVKAHHKRRFREDVKLSV